MIVYERGDLFTTDADIIAHGVNCRGGFGSGVAKLVATKFPKARQRYLEKFENEGWRLGDVQLVKVYGERWIANMATQDGYLPRGVCHADYGAIRTCMEKLREIACAHRLTIAMPKIGAGLAGGDWTKIEAIINDVFKYKEVKVFIL